MEEKTYASIPITFLIHRLLQTSVACEGHTEVLYMLNNIYQMTKQQGIGVGMAGAVNPVLCCC